MDKFIGVMSGTSCDAIDCVLVDFSQDQINVMTKQSYPIASPLKQTLLDAQMTTHINAATIFELDSHLGYLYADTINRFIAEKKLTHNEISAIGLHGQTIQHQPGHTWPHTVQIGDPNVVALKTNITTIADFRRKDVANGGQGAPYAPLIHDHLFRKTDENRVVLNLGGIANISLLLGTTPVAGFDTGPANALMDAWCKRHLGKAYDHGGEWARTGKCVKPLLSALLSDQYFNQAPPKSTGKNHFNLDWLQAHLETFDTFHASDVQATLLELTVVTVVEAITHSVPKLDTLIVCGGGALNSYLFERLVASLPRVRVESSALSGIDPMDVECVLMAWLAKQRIAGSAIDLRHITGAKQATLLGVIFS